MADEPEPGNARSSRFRRGRLYQRCLAMGGLYYSTTRLCLPLLMPRQSQNRASAGESLIDFIRALLCGIK
jgi:hypothetical protein